MDRLLEFPVEVPLSAATSCPLTYPSERDPRTAKTYVLPARAAPEGGTRVSVPVKDFNEVQSFLDAVSTASQSIGALRELQEQMLQARGDVLDELRSVVGEYVDSPTDDPVKWKDWHDRVTARTKVAFGQVRNQFYAATEVVLLSEDEYRAARSKWTTAESAPTPEAAASFRKQAVRETAARGMSKLEEAIAIGREKLATLRKLEAVGQAAMVIDVGVDMYQLLVAKDEAEYQKAVVALTKSGASLVAGGAGAAVGTALVGLMHATPAGWVVTGVALAASAGMGWYVGNESEKLATEFFRAAGFPDAPLP